MEITELGLLTAKAESTYGTDPVPTTSDAIPTVGGSLSYDVETERVDRRAMDRGLMPVPGFNLLPNVRLSFGYELRGNGVIQAGDSENPLEIHRFFNAADLVATYTPESSGGAGDGNVAYHRAPVTNEGPGVTCYWYTQTKLHKLVGGKVDFTIELNVNAVPVINFVIMGKYVAPVDNTFPSSAVLATLKPPVWVNNSNSFGGLATPVLTQARLALGNRVVKRRDAVSANGVKGFAIAGAAPTGSFDPEDVTVATFDFFDKLVALDGNALPFQFDVGATAGNRFRMSGLAQLTRVPYGDREGIRSRQCEFSICKANVNQPDSSALELRFN